MSWVAMKAQQAALQSGDAFKRPSRPHIAICPRPRKADVVSRVPVNKNNGSAGKPSYLIELAEGPYYTIASMFDAATLSNTDTSCRTICAMNRAQSGPWRALGAQTFVGLELEEDGVFEKDLRLEEQNSRIINGRRLCCIDWKGRFIRFRSDVLTFCSPYDGQHIKSIANPDEVAYFRSKLCIDILDEHCIDGVYVEIEVLLNPDNLSMAIVDFESGGCSSVTFSPDTGAVICERKVCEAPRKVEGAYIQPLTSLPTGQRFHGVMGLYLCGGGLAFFRRCAEVQNAGGSTDLGPWETTGYVSDMSWAEGRRLTPSLAFRAEGAYSVRINRVGKHPPLPVGRPSAELHKKVGWSVFDWEANEEDEA